MIIEVPYFKYIKQYKLWKLKNRKLLKQFDIDLKVYDGIVGSSWNGGRVNTVDLPDKGINISFALTNHTINFNDSITHEVLKENHREGNSIIIADRAVIHQLRKLYPNYTYIYSITGFDIKNFSVYKDIEKEFDYIVPRVELIDNDYSDFNMSQYILLYSYECAYCPLYNEHYKMIGEAALDESKQYLVACWFKNKSLFDNTKFNASDYNYEYSTSQKFHNKLTDIDPQSLAGYKIGRNKQEWSQIEGELDEIMELINGF